MIIDDKGRLFGKVNVIDLCVVAVIAAALVFAGTRFLSPARAAVSSGTEDYIIKFFAEEAPEYVVDIIQPGDAVEDESKNIYLGVITNVESGPGYMYCPDANGVLVKSPKEGYKSCEITAELKAQTFANGIIVDGNKYGVGHSFTIRAGKGKIYLKLSGLERKEGA